MLTLACLFTSPEEAGSYLERYKAFEHKPPDMIRERVNDDYMSHLTSALTSIKGVNKTDVITLVTNFGVSGEGLHCSPQKRFGHLMKCSSASLSNASHLPRQRI